jgi:hypothetical protein
MRSLIGGLVLFGAVPATVWSQAAAGVEFRVNSYTSNFQRNASVAVDANGGFVIVWESFLQDGASYGVFGQRFNAAGVAQGGEFRVNSYTTDHQEDAAVASDANGNFVVVWRSDTQDGNLGGVFGRRFDVTGAPQGAEFRVNTYTSGFQGDPGVAADGNGGFIVVWGGNPPGGASGFDIFCRRFDAAGVAQAAEFQVNAYTTGVQALPAIAFGVNGDFVVVWHSDGQDGSSTGVFGRRFDASGLAQGADFQVNSFTTSYQGAASVGADANGNFVVAWQSSTEDGSIGGVFGQRFDVSGARLGNEFRVNSYTTSGQARPSVASGSDGHFVVVWNSYLQDGSYYGVFGQRFNASGVPQGGEFQVNSHTADQQRSPAVASSPDGDFVVAWQSYRQDGRGYGVFGQRFGDLIFEDGFESADLSRWSAAATDGLDLVVLGPAAMAGTSAGLGAFVNDTNALYVQDDTPNGEIRYRARFYFDTNGFDPGEAQSHFRTRIFIAFDTSGLRVITLVLKRQVGAYSIEGRVRLNDGTRADTGFFPINDGPHFFEFDWIRASAPGAMDGFFTLRVDGSVVSTLIGVDDDASAVDFVRMGALGIKTGAGGTLFYDQFESRRQRLIGPE